MAVAQTQRASRRICNCREIALPPKTARAMMMLPIHRPENPADPALTESLFAARDIPVHNPFFGGLCPDVTYRLILAMSAASWFHKRGKPCFGRCVGKTDG
jgi:hypothetical protein